MSLHISTKQNTLMNWLVCFLLLLYQGGTAYDNVAYSDTVCSDMQCMDPSNTRMCISKTADDGTPCGSKKVNQSLVGT